MPEKPGEEKVTAASDASFEVLVVRRPGLSHPV
jgi:precorrin-6x reductase